MTSLLSGGLVKVTKYTLGAGSVTTRLPFCPIASSNSRLPLFDMTSSCISMAGDVVYLVGCIALLIVNVDESERQVRVDPEVPVNSLGPAMGCDYGRDGIDKHRHPHATGTARTTCAE